MNLKTKILDYLDHVVGYRTSEEIAEAVGSTEDRVTKLCGDLYWDIKNGMQRSIFRSEPGHPGEIVLYATKYFVEDNPLR